MVVGRHYDAGTAEDIGETRIRHGWHVVTEGQVRAEVVLIVGGAQANGGRAVRLNDGAVEPANSETCLGRNVTVG